MAEAAEALEAVNTLREELEALKVNYGQAMETKPQGGGLMTTNQAQLSIVQSPSARPHRLTDKTANVEGWIRAVQNYLESEERALGAPMTYKEKVGRALNLVDDKSTRYKRLEEALPYRSYEQFFYYLRTICRIHGLDKTQVIPGEHFYPSVLNLPTRSEGQTFQEWYNSIVMHIPARWAASADNIDIQHQKCVVYMAWITNATSAHYLSDYQKAHAETEFEWDIVKIIEDFGSPLDLLTWLEDRITANAQPDLQFMVQRVKHERQSLKSKRKWLQ